MSGSIVPEGRRCRPQSPDGQPDYCLEHGQSTGQCDKERMYLARITALEGAVAGVPCEVCGGQYELARHDRRVHQFFTHEYTPSLSVRTETEGSKREAGPGLVGQERTSTRGIDLPETSHDPKREDGTRPIPTAESRAETPGLATSIYPSVPVRDIKERPLAEVVALQHALAWSYRGGVTPQRADAWQKGRAQGVEEAARDFEMSRDFKLPERVEAVIRDYETVPHEGAPETVRFTEVVDRLRKALNPPREGT